MSEPANSLRFHVLIEGVPEHMKFDAVFTAIEGLEASYEVKTYDEGGENGFQHQLLGRVRYQNLKLTRPVDGSTKKLSAWFSSFRQEGAARAVVATVVAFNDNREPVAEWTMTGVCPVRYSGPHLSTDQAKVATETLELAHQGFLA
ncbi:phage tail protein [Frankia sp. Cj5]|uniref:phage tail protein n=1 Tax=Frankia sp. Cj5 TaxID=2880978 RepID=UPI001EF5C311|nr:phage tail protein [Frankia sp. Cj5]